MMPYAPFLARRGGAALRHRPAVRRLRRQRRAGRAPAHHPGAAPARAACPSSCCGSMRPATSPSASPARASPSRASAAPARAGTSTPPSRPRAGSSPRSSRRPTASATSPSARTVDRAVRLDPRENSQLAIGLGCDVKYAREDRLCRRPGPGRALCHPDRPGLHDLPAPPLPPARRGAGRADAGGRRDSRRRSRLIRSWGSYGPRAFHVSLWMHPDYPPVTRIRG